MNSLKLDILKLAEELKVPMAKTTVTEDNAVEILEELIQSASVTKRYEFGKEEISVKSVLLRPGESISIRTLAQRKAWDRLVSAYEKRNIERKNKSKHYINNFHDNINEVIPMLDTIEAGILFELTLLMALDSKGFLVSDGRYLTKEDLMNHLGLEKTAFTKYQNKFRELGILDWKRIKMEKVAEKTIKKKGIKAGDVITYTANAYWFNKNFHWMGKFDDNQLIMNFTKTYKLKAMELTKNLSLEAKGLLYMILTSVHYQTYFLSTNPNEDLRMDKRLTVERCIKEGKMFDIQHMIREELIKKINKSESSIKRYIKELYDNSVLAPFGRGKNEKYMVNPELVGRSDNNEHDFTYYDAVVYQFNQLRKDKENRNKK